MHGTSFKLYQFISLTLIGSTFARRDYDFNNLNTLGDQISQSVHEQLAPLQNLGARISASVEEQLAPLRNGRLYNDVHNNNRQFYGFHQHFTPINPPVTGPFVDLSGLNNLGQQIQQSVHEGLEPVRALEIKSKLRNGVGGVTIATHQPEGKTFIIKNYQIYQCEGVTSDEGKCSGSLTPFKPKDKKDYCYNMQGYSIVNNYICLGASSISVINNEIRCESNSHSPALLIPMEEYKKLCEDVSTTVEYKYIANADDPAHVPIPNENKHVKCTNNQPGVCVFTETTTLPNGNGNVFINSYSTGTHIGV